MKAVPNPISYAALFIVFFLSLLLVFQWLWMVHDASVFVSREGILIFDTRRPDDRGFWRDDRVENIVDKTYHFLEKCIPLGVEDKNPMKKVTVVIVSELRFRMLALVSLRFGAASLYIRRWERIYITEPSSLAHEWLHHYFRERAGSVNLADHHHHPVFVKCELYYP